MNCEIISLQIPKLAAGDVSGSNQDALMEHIESCPDCRAALRGAEALGEIRRRDVGETPVDLFDKILATTTRASNQPSDKQRFWLGSAFGGAVAASLFAIAFFLGWTDPEQGSSKPGAEFVVVLGEPRQMHLAFETDRQLPAATISVLLSGDVEIAGYGKQRELEWRQDLDAGVNRLTLPVVANGNNGGQMVVRMTHPLSEQVFVINLPTES